MTTIKPAKLFRHALHACALLAAFALPVACNNISSHSVGLANAISITIDKNQTASTCMDKTPMQTAEDEIAFDDFYDIKNVWCKFSF